MPGDSSVLCGVTGLGKRLARALHKPLTRERKCNATLSSDEQGSTDFVLQIPNSATDSARIDSKSACRAAYAAELRCDNYISQMAKPKSEIICVRHTHPYDQTQQWLAADFLGARFLWLPRASGLVHGVPGATLERLAIAFCNRQINMLAIHC